MAAYQAAWVFPVCGPPIPNGVVAVQQNEVCFVGPRSSYSEGNLQDLNEQMQGPVALLPGLVNAHTHLEFSQLEGPLGDRDSPISDWIPEVIAWRRARDAEGTDATLEAKTRAISQGMRESVQAGVAHIGEISTLPWRAQMHATRPPYTAFLELIALSDQQNDQARQTAFSHLQVAETPRRGLSPHAPYTVNWELLEDAIDLSQRTGAPLQMHLAESLEELEFMQAQTGPFREMLERAGLWESCTLPRDKRPMDYLERLAHSSRCLIAHGNYLNPQEIDYLGQQSNLSVVFCPRTHAYFGHGEHPTLSMLASGVNVALGTDSKASNPDLSVFAEMQFLAQQGVLPHSDILRMATCNGAAALGDERGGLIETGAPANLAAFKIGSAPDAYDALFSAESCPQQLMLGGQWVEQAEGGGD